MRALVIGLLAAGVLTFATASQARAEQSRAETTQEIIRQIIEDLKIHPPATDGDDMVGEKLC